MERLLVSILDSWWLMLIRKQVFFFLFVKLAPFSPLPLGNSVTYIRPFGIVPQVPEALFRYFFLTCCLFVCSIDLLLSPLRYLYLQFVKPHWWIFYFRDCIFHFQTSHSLWFPFLCWNSVSFITSKFSFIPLSIISYGCFKILFF